ncbi:nucleotidyltransferase family protein [Akkermansiaceae bacterium]|nr:nucleotidyltransferase family protein [Akkermansiaceae bacterium]MDA7887871.1 nucleotidyltransferase family protein [Akkermansiaceae bacterium]MDB4544659.1 nucleotidyltransferase family protein [Akkermansiaceae bacterium]
MISSAIKLQAIRILETESILSAMAAIDAGAIQMAVVENGEGVMVGLITDGDIRRGLLAGMSLSDPIEACCRRDFISVSEGTARVEVLEMMLARSFEHVPVVDERGCLKGMHLLTEFLSPQRRENIAVVMAGGRGTRLGELTRNLPKPMIKVAGRPILERIIHQLVGAGVTKIYLAVNYLAEVIEDYFGDGRKFGCQISYLREESPLGSGGALSLLPHPMEEAILVMNGDLVSEFDVERFLEAHEKTKAAITVGVQSYEHQVPFGCVQIEDRKIRALVEKPTLSETINTGIYAIAPKYVAMVPNSFYPITSLVETALGSGDVVTPFQIDEWVDVGEPKQLAMARGEDH